MRSCGQKFFTESTQRYALVLSHRATWCRGQSLWAKLLYETFCGWAKVILQNAPREKIMPVVVWLFIKIIAFIATVRMEIPCRTNDAEIPS